MMLRRCLLLIGFMVVAGGAMPTSARQATPPATPAEADGLPETLWYLAEVTLADGTVVSIDDPSLYTIQFLPDGQLAARADCNQVAGEYTIDGSTLTFSPLLSTLVGCPEGSLGSDFTAWLDQVLSYELGDDGLVLVLDDGGRLQFVPALVGVTWQWQRFEESTGTVTAPDNPANYTLRFEQDGSLLVRADCNTGRAGYTTDGSMIEIEPIALTRMACGEESLGSEFVRDLEEVSSYAFTGGQLALALPVDVGILLFVGRADGDALATPEAG
jgi:heat shock protein HslJ